MTGWTLAVRNFLVREDSMIPPLLRETVVAVANGLGWRVGGAPGNADSPPDR
jgi:hypothetical protein